MTAKGQHGNIFLLVRCVLVTPASGQISTHAILQAKTILKKSIIFDVQHTNTHVIYR